MAAETIETDSVIPSQQVHQRVYFQDLDLLRLLAALMIVALHGYEGWCNQYGFPGSFTTGDYKSLTFTGRLADHFIRNMSFGVDLFFMISGFLITYLLFREKEQTGKIYLGKFYMRRILRIWPLYYLLVAVGPLLVTWAKQVHEPDYFSTALFINNFSTIRTGLWTYPYSHFWSICIEEHFYLVWPLVIALVTRKTAVPVFSAVIALSILFRAYAFYNLAYPWMTLFAHTFSRMDILALGSLFGYLHYVNPKHISVPRIPLMLMYGLLVFLLVNDTLTAYENIFDATVKKFFYCIVAGIAMHRFVFRKDGKTVSAKPGIFHYFGKISYGIYMYHNVIIMIIIQQFMIPYGNGNLYLYLLIYLSSTLLVSVISYECIERPFLRLKSTFEIIHTRQ